MDLIMGGQAAPVPLAGFLTAYRLLGLGAADMTGFARSMRRHALPVRVALGAGEVLIDTCGTGGDGTGTFNISTVTALVVAGAGVKVAKHGNRSVSSTCGSADILEALGVRIRMAPEEMAADIERAGFSFLFAQALHPGMRHVGPVRAELRMRTLFNLLGPLANPAGAETQLVGAPSAEDARHMAEALAALGTRRAMVVHGSDGLDEITLTGSSTVFRVAEGAVREEVWKPEDFGVARGTLESLRGGDRDTNAAIAREILAGRERGPRRDVVLLNAMAALMVAREWEPAPALAAARESIDSGAAERVLTALQTA